MGRTIPSILDIARYCSIYLQQEGGWIDSWSLQKLTYYSQAWSLAWDSDPLFEEKFEAWSDGPVSRKLFQANKERSSYTSADLPGGNPDALTERPGAKPAKD